MGRPPGRDPRGAPSLDQAAQALQARRPEEAARLAQAVLNADRGNLLAAQILGTALLALNRPGEALAPLQRAARRGGDPAIETLLARVLTASGRRDEAFDQLRLAIERLPPYPLAFLDLGEGLGAAGRLEEAAAVLERGLELIPAADGLRIALGYIHLKAGDRAAARRAFQAVRDAAPGRQDAMVGLARVMTLEGQYAQAADLYRQALAKRPDDAPSRIGLGKCLLELGKREDGEAMIRQAARQAPEFAGLAVAALSAASHGRFFLRPSAALNFLGAAPSAVRP